MSRCSFNRLLLALFLLLVLPVPSWASNNARNFGGGATTDNLVSSSTLTPTTQRSVYLRFKISALDATTRRAFEWGDGTTTILNFFVDSSTFELIAGWSTTNGDWTIAAASAGAEHDVLITYDGSSTANVPTVYLDGSAVTVTQFAAPVGTVVNTAKVMTIGNRPDHTRAFNGWISTVAVWNTVLSAGNATTLHGGTAPCAIGSPIAYWPINIGESPEPELVSNNTATVTGTTVVSGSTILTNPRCTSSGSHGFLLLGVGQ